jgi:DNA-binding MarR family transcriptional regulator
MVRWHQAGLLFQLAAAAFPTGAYTRNSICQGMLRFRCDAVTRFISISTPVWARYDVKESRNVRSLEREEKAFGRSLHLGAHTRSISAGGGDQREERASDQVMAESGLRLTQFSILYKLAARGTQAMTGLSALMAMDRTTVGRNLKLLERDGLLRYRPGPDGRERMVELTAMGRKKLEAAYPLCGCLLILGTPLTLLISPINSSHLRQLATGANLPTNARLPLADRRSTADRHAVGSSDR